MRAADERAVGAGHPGLAEVALQPGEPERGVGRQRPALHLAVRRGRQVGEPAARHRVERVVQPAQHDLAALDQPADRRHEAVQPALAVHPLLGAGPAAELLAVVGQHREPVARAAELAQVVRGLLRRAEGDQIAEPLVDREERDPLAVALGPERRVELLGGEAGDQEVPVVHQRVAHAGVGQVGGELRLPDPLGEPEAARVDAEAAAHRLVHPADLLDPVLRAAARRAPARRSRRAGSRSGRRRRGGPSRSR